MPSTVDRVPDAVLLLSFGGPRGPQDVVPFLRNVTAGRGIPDERLREVGEHYYGFGGASPINEQNLALLDALTAGLRGRGYTGPVTWGNRNWDPYLIDALRDLVDGGARRIRVLTTSAYSSYSSCRQYRENVADALAELEPEGVTADLVGPFYDAPGFIEANADAVRTALAQVPAGSAVVFVTHSIPTAMGRSSTPTGTSDDDGGDYVAQHRAVAEQVLAAVGVSGPVDLAFCSRSGPPTQPWLEPDINDRLRELAGGVPGVVVSPIGFISDHMEVIYDLDTEAAATAAELGLPFARAATAGTHPSFVSALVDRVLGPCATPPITMNGLPEGAGRCGGTCCPNLRRR